MSSHTEMLPPPLSLGAAAEVATAIVTLTSADLVPPGPVQFSVNVVSEEIGPTLTLVPLVPRTPVQLAAPEATQEVASVVDQLTVVLP